MITDKHYIIQGNGEIICVRDYQNFQDFVVEYQHIDNSAFDVFTYNTIIYIRKLRDCWSDNIADALRRIINNYRDNYTEISVSDFTAFITHDGRISISNDLSDEEIVELIHIMLMNKEVNKNDRQLERSNT